ncbi:DUF3597 family protein [Phenylobacterium sp.]|jgi:hypothetical protein|uniref:DUF3597 family protein n=1 Tax=Phenylobacterium sp. TaxID=1871053 RepID=UPI002ED8A5F9
MRLLQKIYDTLHGGADGPPPLKALDPERAVPVPVRTRMGTPADLAMILDERAARTGVGGNWRDSLSALLALAGLDDTDANRAHLAEDLNVDVSGLDATKADAALHAALIQRMADDDAVPFLK